MKTLNLSAIGVAELNQSEMIETEGGSILGIFLVACAIVALIYACGGEGHTTIEARN